MSDTSVQPASTVLEPSLRGPFVQSGLSVICRGYWAMSDAGHEFPDQKSEFEFKLQKPLDGQSQYPISGKYQGWFFLKQLPPAKGYKVEDKDMIIKFSKKEDGTYLVDGVGSNRFGSFSLHGSLDANGYIVLYREYAAKPVPVSNKRGRSDSIKKSLPPIDTSIARENSSRPRKLSSFMKEYDEPATTPRSKPPLPTPKSNIPGSTSNSSNINGGVRTQRIPTSLIKCNELLKEIMKHPQSMWFLEPVDDVKLNLPDYRSIITRPMDFGTVSSNLQQNNYESPEQFGEHMRLVFRNAITYNQMRDHPVHVAARELNQKFEEKFRILMTNFTLQQNALLSSSSLSVEPKLVRSSSFASVGSNYSKKSSKSPRVGNNQWTKQRQLSNAAFLPPAGGLDSSSSLFELQRKMQEMQDEILQLRTTVRQQAVKSNLEVKRSVIILLYEQFD